MSGSGCRRKSRVDTANLPYENDYGRDPPNEPFERENPSVGCPKLERNPKPKTQTPWFKKSLSLVFDVLKWGVPVSGQHFLNLENPFSGAHFFQWLLTSLYILAKKNVDMESNKSDTSPLACNCPGSEKKNASWISLTKNGRQICLNMKWSNGSWFGKINIIIRS